MFEVVIFDLDGLLVDSEPLQFKAFNEVFSRYGTPMTHEEYRRWRGWKVTARWTESRNTKLDPERLSEEKKQAYDRLIREEMQLKPGAGYFVKLIARHCRLCIASGSRRDSIEACLEKFSLRNHFEEVVSATELNRGKPHPDVFLEVLSQMNVSAKDVLVVEDSVAGLRAAVAAGIQCIICPDKFAPESIENYNDAALVVCSLEELTLEILRKLAHQAHN